MTNSHRPDWSDIRAKWLRIAFSVLATSVLVIAISFLFRWFGFAPWSKMQFLSLVNAIGWPHAVGTVLVFFLCYFRHECSALIGRIKRISKDGVDFHDIVREQADELIESEISTSSPATSGQQPDDNDLARDRRLIRVDDVRDAFDHIELIDRTNFESDCETAHSWLLRNEVRTVGQLTALANSQALLEELGRIYVSELRRNYPTPLDPIAVATWGTMLFRFGLRSDVIDALRSQLRRTPEYRRANG